MVQKLGARQAAMMGGGMGAKVALILPQGSLTGQADLLLV